MSIVVQRKFIISLITILIAIALVYGFLPKPVTVNTATVSLGPLQVVIEEEGKTRLIDRFIISAPVTGSLCRLDWNVGDVVKAGQQLCKLSPLRSELLDPRSKAKAEDRLAAAKASLRTAKANVMADIASTDYAQSEYQRIQQIYDKQLISRSHYEKIAAEYQRAKAMLKSSRFAAETARYALAEARNALNQFSEQSQEIFSDGVSIYSPIDGQILTVNKESEGMVNAGEVVLEVGDIRALEIIAEVLSADAVQIQHGMNVEIQRWGGEQILSGRVNVIEPTGFTKISALGVEEQRVKIVIKITSPSDQWKRLGDGYRVDIKFILWQNDKVLQIPENALFRNQNGWSVFVVNRDNHAELRMVSAGKRSGLVAQILNGLSEGELVITHPNEQITDGRKISLEN